MFKKVCVCFLMIFCFYLLSLFRISFADLGAKVSTYTKTIEVSSINGTTTIYNFPDVIPKIPENSIIDCKDGIVILEISGLELFLEKGDKIQLSKNSHTGKIDISSLSDDVHIARGEKRLRIMKKQTVALDSIFHEMDKNNPVINNEEKIMKRTGTYIESTDTETKIDTSNITTVANPPFIDDEPDLIHASPYH